MDKTDKLVALLQAADIKNEFDIVGDLEQLRRLYGIIKARDYKKKLTALIEKYKNSEITEIRSALLKKCLAGDTNAIRLYCDYFRHSDAEEAQDDGLTAAILAKGNEVFDGED